MKASQTDSSYDSCCCQVRIWLTADVPVTTWWQGEDVRPDERGEDVLWNRINRQEVAWGLGGKQRNRTGFPIITLTLTNIEEAFQPLSAQTLYCMIAILHSSNVRHTVMFNWLYINQIFFATRFPGLYSLWTAAVTASAAVCVVCLVSKSRSWKETPEEIVAGGIKSWLGCEQECVQ